MSKDWLGNGNSIYKTLGASNHTTEERETNDYYATEPRAVDALVKVETLCNNIWECACGEKHLSNRLGVLGYNVYSTDLVVRADDVIQQDFLSCKNHFNGDIITNPPYKYAKEFVLKSLELLEEGHKCCMFLKLTFLEGKSRYKELFSKYPPKAIHVFSSRVLCAKNGEFDKMKQGGGSAVAYAWFVWEKGVNSQTVIDWI